MLTHIDAETGQRQTLASDIEIAETIPARMKGRMFTDSISDDYALLFPLSEASWTPVWMLFVPYDLGVIWLEGEEVTATETLSAWTGLAAHTGDTIIETHPKNLTAISPGDTIRQESD